MDKEERLPEDEVEDYQFSIVIRLDNKFTEILVENWKSLESNFLDEARSRKVTDPKASISSRFISGSDMDLYQNLFLFTINLAGESIKEIFNLFQFISSSLVIPRLITSEELEEISILEYMKKNYTIQLTKVKKKNSKDFECSLIAFSTGSLMKIYDNIEEVISFLEMFVEILAQYIQNGNTIPIAKMHIIGLLNTKKEKKIIDKLKSQVKNWIKDTLFSEAKETDIYSISINTKLSEKEYIIQVNPRMIYLIVNYSVIPFKIETKDAIDSFRQNIRKIMKDDFINILRKVRGE